MCLWAFEKKARTVSKFLLSRSWIIPTLTLLTFALLLIAREPKFFTHPRFYAEEGSVFFRFSYLNDFFSGLLFVPRGTAGYYLLCATLPTTLASRISLEMAPFVTTYFSYFFILCLLACILFGRSFLWNRLATKIIACAGVLVAAFSTPTVWLNTINLQVFCAMFTTCLLVEDLRNCGRLRRNAYRTLTAFCGLSGLYSAAILPAFLLTAWRDRVREKRVLAAILFVCTSLQGVIFLVLRFSDGISSKKMLSLPLHWQISQALLFQVLSPILGAQRSRAVFRDLGIPVKTLGDLAVIPEIVWLFVVLYIGLMLWLLTGWRSYRQISLVMAMLGVTTLALVGAQNGVLQGRYSVVPIFILFVLFMSQSRLFKFQEWKTLRSLSGGLAAVLLAAMCFNGIFGYGKWSGETTYVPSAPLWRDEIQEWRRNPSDKISVFPHPRWKFYLPRREPLVAVNQSLATLLGQQIGPSEVLRLTHPDLRNLTWEGIRFCIVQFESTKPVNKLRGKLTLSSIERPSDPIEMSAKSRSAQLPLTLVFRLPVSEDAEPWAQYQQSDTLELSIRTKEAESLRLKRIFLAPTTRLPINFF